MLPAHHPHHHHHHHHHHRAHQYISPRQHLSHFPDTVLHLFLFFSTYFFSATSSSSSSCCSPTSHKYFLVIFVRVRMFKSSMFIFILITICVYVSSFGRKHNLNGSESNSSSFRLPPAFNWMQRYHQIFRHAANTLRSLLVKHWGVNITFLLHQ